MTPLMLALILTFLATIFLQALLPRYQLVVVIAGSAACSLLAVSHGKITMEQIWQRLPWNVMAILVSLNLFFAVLPSNVVGYLSLKASNLCRGRESRLLLVFPVMMFVLSGVMNNLAAMNVVLPVVLVTVKNLSPQKKYLNLLFAALLVACNLGGAATPIGDFPAILLLGHGGMSFGDYLVWAAPVCILILVVVLFVFRLLSRDRADKTRTSFEERLAVTMTQKLYRKSKIRWRVFLPATFIFTGMVVCWINGVPADLVCLTGLACILVVNRKRSVKAFRNDLEVTTVFFLISLFVMIEAVTSTGILDELAQHILRFNGSPRIMLVVFMVSAAMFAGVFSAAPSMAAMLPIADILTEHLPAEPIYVGLALAVCAGSCLFITSATSGVLAQEKIEASGVTSQSGEKFQFRFIKYMPYGALASLIVLASGILYVLIRI